MSQGRTTLLYPPQLVLPLLKASRSQVSWRGEGVYGLRGLVKKVAWGLNIEIDTLYMTRDWGWVVIKVGSGWSHK